MQIGFRAVASERAGGPQFLAEQLTLFQPGGQIMPTTVLWALSGPNSPWRPCNGKAGKHLGGGVRGFGIEIVYLSFLFSFLGLLIPGVPGIMQLNK